MENVLKKIFYFRCQDYFDLTAVIHLLPEFSQRNLPVKLVVVDSIASHFRYSFDDFSRRAKLLNGLMQKLTALAIDNDIAVRMLFLSFQQRKLEGNLITHSDCFFPLGGFNKPHDH